MKQGANLKSRLAIFLLLAMLCTSKGGKFYIDRDATVAEIQQHYAPDEIIVKFKNAIAKTLAEKMSASSDAAQLELSSSVDKLNKKFGLRNIRPVFKNFKAKRERLKAVLKKDKTLLTKQEKRILQRLKRADKSYTAPDLDRIYKLQFDLALDASIQDVLAAYNRDPSVEYVELNYIVSIDSTPNDPLYPVQWPLNNTGQIYPESGYYNHPPGTPDCDIDAPEAWDMETGNSDVIVAVVDTGVDYTHSDLDDNMWINTDEIPGNLIDDDKNGYIDDIYGYDFCTYGGQTRDPDPIDDDGHGTHIAGTIAAEGNNGLDIIGVCWKANIMATKFLDSNGYGYTSDAVNAFYYAIDNGADIISISWGGGNYSQTMEDAINYAHSQGVIMVASAGNRHSDTPQYPANYNHVIAVAATDSNDKKASFSNYGDWVDIAAPGVDILSLRAYGTSMGTTYDAYTTIASGTSMACPHVAGAAALLLSIYPETQVDEIRRFLTESTDSVNPGICTSGRLNAYQAMLQMIAPQGQVALDSEVYSCSAMIRIGLFDSDLQGQGTYQVVVETDGGDFETVLLTETTPALGVFSGTISTDSGNPNLEDGILQVADAQTLTVIYYDANDGTGNPATVEATVTTDCREPTIFDVEMFDITSTGARVVFRTSEPATGLIRYGQSCGGPDTVVGDDTVQAMYYNLYLPGLNCETQYYFKIYAKDAVGNETIDSNGVQCYSFTTDPTPPGLHVPGEYTTIQEAIDAAANGEIVWIADGVYTGEGNRDVDFKGKAITVRSENGPENCIIDCQEQGRGFLFNSNEDMNSILEGLTITNGSSFDYSNSSGWLGGGILCDGDSSPAIVNCIITGNSAIDGGGIACFGNNSVFIHNCIISENYAASVGGGMRLNAGNQTIINCIISGNYADEYGYAIYGGHKLTFINCIISNNIGWGYAIEFWGSSFRFLNCLISDNSWGGIKSAAETMEINNCTIAGNEDDDGYCYGIFLDPWFYPTNRATISNSIIYDRIEDSDRVSLEITYSNVKGGWEGEGNIDVDPLFISGLDGDYHLLPVSMCINAGDPDYIQEPNEADLDGNPRIIGGRIDMGAYEYRPPLSPIIRIVPHTINLASEANRITALLWLGKDYEVGDIDPNSVLLEGKIKPQWLRIGGEWQVAMAGFNREEVQSILDMGEVELTITGKLTDGTVFEATDVIRVIDKGNKK